MNDPRPPLFAHAADVPRPPDHPEDQSSYVLDFLVRHGLSLDAAAEVVRQQPVGSLHASALYAYHADVAIAQAWETTNELRLSSRLTRQLPYAYVFAIIGLFIGQWLPLPWSAVLVVVSGLVPALWAIRIGRSLKAGLK